MTKKMGLFIYDSPLLIMLDSQIVTISVTLCFITLGIIVLICCLKYNSDSVFIEVMESEI